MTCKGQRGQISISFNWIFILIAGVVFLGFFFSLINSSSQANDDVIASQLARSFENQLSIASSEADLVKTIDDTSRLNLEFICNQEEGIHDFVVNDIRIRDTKYDLYFSPPTLSGNKVMFWMLAWKLPYQIATFSYITNTNHLYIFVDDGSDAMKNIIESFPQNISSTVINSSTETQLMPSQDMGYDRYIYVVSHESQASLEQNDIVDLSTSHILLIKPYRSDDIFSHGEIFFLTPQEYPLQQTSASLQAQGNDLDEGAFDVTTETQVQPSFYLGKASLYGALFSTTKQRYECAMSKALYRLRLNYMLQTYRLEESFPHVSRTCQELLGKSTTGPYQTFNNSLELIEEGLHRETIVGLAQASQDLTRFNAQLQQVSSCPPIY